MTIIHIKAPGSIPLSQFASAAASSAVPGTEAPLLSTCEAYTTSDKSLRVGTWEAARASSAAPLSTPSSATSSPVTQPSIVTTASDTSSEPAMRPGFPRRPKGPGPCTRRYVRLTWFGAMMHRSVRRSTSDSHQRSNRRADFVL